MNWILGYFCFALGRKASKKVWRYYQCFTISAMVASIMWLGVLYQRKYMQYLERETIRKAIDAYTGSSSIYMKAKQWNDFQYVFIGGLPFSGASTLERLLSSQDNFLGLNIHSKIISNTSSCERPKKSNPLHQCLSHENDGDSVTKVFSMMYAKRGTVCRADAVIRGTEFGECARHLHLDEKDVAVLGKDIDTIRLRLYADWVQFWFSPPNRHVSASTAAARSRSTGQSNTSKLAFPPPVPLPTAAPLHIYSTPYIPDDFKFNATRSELTATELSRRNSKLVSMDVSNLVRSRFMQALWGADRTVFIFSMRHPLMTPRCRYLKCDVIKHVKAWLETHRVVEDDLKKLNHYVVVQYDGLLRSPREVAGHMSRVLGVASLLYSNTSSHIANSTVTAVKKSAGSRAKTKGSGRKHLGVKNSTLNGTSHTGTFNTGTSQTGTSQTSTSHKIGPRRLISKTLSLHHHSQTHTPPSTLISLNPTAEDSQWASDYSALIKSSRYDDIRSALQELETELLHFCYSALSLEPIVQCGSGEHWAYPRYIWRMKI